MTHQVTGLIGDNHFLQRAIGSQWTKRLTDLGQGFALLALPAETVDAPVVLEVADAGDGFQYVTPRLLEILSEMSRGGRIAYFETEYSGGLGGQGAIVFDDTRVAYGPCWADKGPINSALKMLGVRVTPPAIDEFDTLKLGRYRMTEHWVCP